MCSKSYWAISKEVVVTDLFDLASPELAAYLDKDSF